MTYIKLRSTILVAALMSAVQSAHRKLTCPGSPGDGDQGFGITVGATELANAGRCR
jgi:hypothetical protein